MGFDAKRENSEIEARLKKMEMDEDREKGKWGGDSDGNGSASQASHAMSKGGMMSLASKDILMGSDNEGEESAINDSTNSPSDMFADDIMRAAATADPSISST